MKPLIKWPGGKRALVPLLKELYAPYENLPLYEPFAGGMAITLGVAPKQAILNDVCEPLINLYQQIKDGLEVTIPLKNTKEYYYECRGTFNALEKSESNDPLRAQLFYYLNRAGYNGLCRFNRKGGYNVPFGKHKRLYFLGDLRPYRDLFQGYEFHSHDFEFMAIPDDLFIYADPPYDGLFTSYSNDVFTWEDHIRLAHWLAERNSPIVVSNRETQRVIELYSDLGFDVHNVSRRTTISASKKGRKTVPDVLMTKNIEGVDKVVETHISYGKEVC